MAILFNIMDTALPLAIETIGHDWEQEPVERLSGYHYYHWLQTSQGCGKVVIQGQEFSLTPGMGILIFPFITHHYYQTSAEPWRTNFITLGGTIASSIPTILTVDHFCLASDSQNFSFADWNAQLYEELTHSQPLSPLDYSIEAYRFLAKIKEHHNQEHVVTDERYLKFVQPVIQWMDEHYMLDCSTQEMAQLVFISPQYLSRLFQRFVKLSPYDYLTALRIKKAKERLLTLPTEKIKDVASQVGFNDASHFIATFKKATDYTPVTFRKLY
ncbi:AraC family transcriptional regulator [uncultured Vagococcus sp.]|uniref:AraC family transcriptional regulator n=1 Tax=uncultured Vagococcus sp. TaxID=189676 RepID=UPI0028D20BEA|nr:AraC family transcriptional regulator [uncultured Vagococcus sp.]